MVMPAQQLAVRRVTRLDGKTTVKAFCDVAVANLFVIKSLKVIEGRNGLFISMPREQGRNGQWYDLVSPATKEARERLTEVVLEAYNTKEPAF